MNRLIWWIFDAVARNSWFIASNIYVFIRLKLPTISSPANITRAMITKQRRTKNTKTSCRGVSNINVWSRFVDVSEPISFPVHLISTWVITPDSANCCNPERSIGPIGELLLSMKLKYSGFDLLMFLKSRDWKTMPTISSSISWVWTWRCLRRSGSQVVPL